MPALVPVRYIAPARRLHCARFLRCLPGISPGKALAMFAQVVAYNRDEARRDAPRLLKWVSSEPRAVAMRHKLPARLRRHVQIIDDSDTDA